MEPTAVVLIVDDYAIVREALAQSLAAGGFSVLKAGDGEEAVRIAREQHPECILLDVHMPGMDGFETAKRLRETKETAGIPILFLTGEAKDVDHMKEGFDLGAEDYLTKGQSTREIIIRVEHAILRHRQQQI